MPFDSIAPSKIHRLAIMRMVFIEAALDHTAEFRKLTASFATHTTRSRIAKRNSVTTIRKKMSPMR